MGVDMSGVLALGLVVGFLLGFGLLKSGPTLKAVLTVLGAAFGGAPILFMGDTTAKWMYPIGLLVGMLWLRVISARLLIAEKVSRPSKERNVHGLFAWIDIIVIVALTAGVAVYATVTADDRSNTLAQTGQFKITSLGEHEIFYPEPYASTPNLTFSKGTDNPERFSVLEQRPDGFKVSLGGAATINTIIEWSATGIPKRE